jgi:hypothetical protein
MIKLRRGSLKRGNGDFALITTHPKLKKIDNRVRKGFSSPMKSMAKGALNVHLSKTVNHPSMIKRLACNRKRLRYRLWKHLKI